MYRQLTDGEVETATIVYGRYTSSLVIRDMQNLKNEILFSTYQIGKNYKVLARMWGNFTLTGGEVQTFCIAI